MLKAIMDFISGTDVNIGLWRYLSETGQVDYLIEFSFNIGFVVLIVVSILISKYFPWR